MRTDQWGSLVCCASLFRKLRTKVATDLQTMVENRRLQDLICDIKVPTEMVPEIKDGKGI